MTGNIEKSFSLKGKTAVVTGAGGLLGSGFSRTLARAGAQVVVADVNGKTAQAVVDSIRRESLIAESVQVDVTDPDSVQKMFEFCEKAFGPAQILICSAALDPKFDPEHFETHLQGYEQYSLQAWQQSINVNLTGLFLCTQKAIAGMRRAGSGSIILISSIYGLRAPDQRLYERDDGNVFHKPPDYAVTKAGVLGLMRYLAAYYGKDGIRVNALSPGGVYNGHDEQFLKRYSQHTMLGRMMNVEELDGAILFLASDTSSYMTGANLIVDGGWTAW